MRPKTFLDQVISDLQRRIEGAVLDTSRTSQARKEEVTERKKILNKLLAAAPKKTDSLPRKKRCITRPAGYVEAPTYKRRQDTLAFMRANGRKLTPKTWLGLLQASQDGNQHTRHTIDKDLKMLTILGVVEQGGKVGRSREYKAKK